MSRLLVLAFALAWLFSGSALANGLPGAEQLGRKLSSGSYLVILIAAAFVVGTSLWVLIDAKRRGVGLKTIDGLKTLGPWGWFAASLGVWPLAFPLYLWSRKKQK
ncbi:MAG: hypothetical protein V3S39_04380 [Thermodesulfobacteriota bacterium]